MTITEISKPTIDERLASASSSSNLAPQRDSTMPLNTLDYLTAAGWSGKKAAHVLGRALIALESEWDTAEQPRVPREHDIQTLISVLPRTENVFDVDGQLVRDAEGRVKTVAISAKTRAAAGRAQAHAWYEGERVRLIARLRTLPMAHRALTAWGENNGIRNAEAKARSLLAWWLDHRCPKCLGTMLDPVTLGGRGSCRVCTACHGSGERPLPFDDHRTQDGRILERAMIGARHDAMQKMKNFTANHSHHK